MNGCGPGGTEAVELYFYGELDAPARARIEAHLAGCAECRQVLGELQVIGRALASRPRVEAPPAGDWSGFMRRLDDACRRGNAEDTRQRAEGAGQRVESTRQKVEGAGQKVEGTRQKVEGAGQKVEGRRPSRAALAIAASLLLVTAAAVFTLRTRPEPVAVPAPSAAPGSPAPVAASTTRPADRSSNRALAELSEQHLERSKLVVLGLVARDPEHTDAKDWAYERDLAGSLLEDTRLYRRAAQEHGLSNIAHVMGDLETVLLETSMSDHADAASLERVQRLIRKRDLVVKMQVVASTGI
jgi:hypothetical protein